MKNDKQKNTLVSKEARKEIKDLVLEQLKMCNIHNLPVDPVSIVMAHKNWCLFTATEAYENRLIEKPYFDFNGCHFHDEKFQYIVYNERHSYERQRWTVSHEISHVFRGHVEYSPIEEAEANYFAKQLLMPIAVLSARGIVTKEQISTACGVSIEAAGYRVKDIQRHEDFKAKYGLTAHDIAFLKQFGCMDISDELCPILA